MKPILVLNVVGLTPKLLREAMPNLQRWAKTQTMLPLIPDLPAVTCTVQASMLTGQRPGRSELGPGHGAVANGWFFRDLSEVWLWRQSVELITGDSRGLAAHSGDPTRGETTSPSPASQVSTIFDRWREAHRDSKSAQIFWWWNLPSRADISVTPRPTYWADGRKGPDIHAHPGALRDRLQQRLGKFPLFQFWGPGAGIASTKWIIDATLDVLKEDQPGLTLAYLPHLDYDLQRYGPDGPEALAAGRALDAELVRLLDYAQRNDMDLLVLSEYGIEPVHTAIEPNRALRNAGLLEVHAAANGALLDPGNSQAFAVCDHQAAHVYVQDPNQIGAVAKLLQDLPGVESVHQGKELETLGLAHPRSGELFLVAEPGHWFAYPYWIEGDQEPDFARTVDIHQKPGYDPCELFLDPKIPFVKARILNKLLKKKLGFRTLMNVIPLDTSLVKGSHGRPPTSIDHGPVFIAAEHFFQLNYQSISAHQTLNSVC
jgi:predicted AlkP superfamily pyrophosphatase or phosphodiesterase